MLESVYLDYEIPIWRYFYQEDTKIPYEFTYKNKKYTNGITIIQFGWDIDKYWICNTPFLSNLDEIPNPILCAPNLEIYNVFKRMFS